MNWTEFIISTIIEIIVVFVMFFLFLLIFTRPLIKWVMRITIKRLYSKEYKENIWEVITASTRTDPITIVENSLRSHFGQIIKRPFGTPRKFINFDGLVFSPAQLHRLPTHRTNAVNMKVTIGPNAKKPLVIDIPLLSAPMGYGVALSKKVKRAIAKATAAVGTAANSGQGLFLPEEREFAKYFILQYTPCSWSKDPEVLRQADAIEIYIGQGANAASPLYVAPKDLTGKIREKFRLSPNETLVIPSNSEEMIQPEDLKELVNDLREITAGIPIGIKICPCAELEADLEIAIKANVDFISLDGGQAGSSGGAPIFEDDFSLPTIYALSRAVQYLNKRGLKDKISLLIGGGFNTPGECLKALALGANAVYMGTALIWSMTHDQISKTMPWEPPTQLIYYSGKMKNKFDENLATHYLINFLNSCVKEMKEAIRALGKTSIQEVNAEDLVALDEITSNITKVRLAYEKKR
ncbi:FMN-binding glutamate synthase family protein [Alkalihalobacillus sp. BA299]|uniref:FMN-binding glutamate synthase family protein n=1 Tax=Alkalihalobacillus sp. BA299 TaxID=2815938 RepID=UPI001AD9E709|nr:FMN-binding glutamate synthase family protein [Alkalihalobacillus sp. BA299]